MKILYHHRTRAEDAQGVHIQALCDAFRALGHEVKVIGLLARQKNGRLSKNNKSRTTGNSLFSFRIPHWFYECLALIYNIPSFIVLTITVLTFKPNCMYERYSLFTLSGLWTARLFNLPFFLEVNAPLSLEMKTYEALAFKKVAQCIEDWLCSNATKTLVVSQVMREILVRRGLTPHKFVIMPNGIDPEYFNSEINGERIKRSLNLKNRFVVGFVGWMRPWHGIDKLIKAVAVLQTQLPHLRLLLVGDGPAVPELQTKTRRLGLQKKVNFTGPVPRPMVPEYIAAMDVAVQPDVTEYASPIKLFEYLAMGKAIIVPRKPNIQEILEDGKHALLYTPDDAQELADKIERLYVDPALRQRLGLAASRLIEERGFYWRSNAARIIDLLEGNHIQT